MDILDFTMLENQLSHSKVKIEFIKVDGTYRVMICTKSPEIITAANMPVGANKPPVNETILRVFDVEKQAWRSMRKDRITQWELAS